MTVNILFFLYNLDISLSVVAISSLCMSYFTLSIYYYVPQVQILREYLEDFPRRAGAGGIGSTGQIQILTFISTIREIILYGIVVVHYSHIPRWIFVYFYNRSGPAPSKGGCSYIFFIFFALFAAV